MQQLVLIEISEITSSIRCLECGARIRNVIEYRQHRAEAGTSHAILPAQYFALYGQADKQSLTSFCTPKGVLEI
jgi:hypothetical protein